MSLMNFVKLILLIVQSMNKNQDALIIHVKIHNLKIYALKIIWGRHAFTMKDVIKSNVLEHH